MRRLAPLTTFCMLALGPALGLADEPPERPRREQKPETKPENKADDDKSKGCSVSDEDDAMLGLAALALLLSGVALRRRAPR